MSNQYYSTIAESYGSKLLPNAVYQTLNDPYWAKNQIFTTPQEVPFATPLTFDTAPNGALQGRIIGNLSTLFIQSQTEITFSQLPYPNVPTAIINPQATAQNAQAGLFVSTSILAGDAVQANRMITNSLQVSSINGLEQNPSNTRFGFYTQNSGGAGTTAVLNAGVKPSSIILAQPFGSLQIQPSTISYSTNPVAGVGFTSIASSPLDNPQPMSYYIVNY